MLWLACLTAYIQFHGDHNLQCAHVGQGDSASAAAAAAAAGKAAAAASSAASGGS